jgi:hypothetical protein
MRESTSSSDTVAHEIAAASVGESVLSLDDMQMPFLGIRILTCKCERQ